MPDSYSVCLLTSAMIFAIGAFGVTVRRNPLVMFMCLELMLNASNLAFATFARHSPAMRTMPVGGADDGPMFIFLVMIIAAAEAVIGLAIIIAIFRSRSDVDTDEMASLKG